jgi:hypothetical protein
MFWVGFFGGPPADIDIRSVPGQHVGGPYAHVGESGELSWTENTTT